MGHGGPHATGHGQPAPLCRAKFGLFPAWPGSVHHGWILYVESAGAGAANCCHSLEGVGDSEGDAVADSLGGI